MKIQTPGLIIKETNIGENDKLLVILTREHGIIRAFADGVRRMKSKNTAATSLFCYANFTLYQNKDTYKLSDSLPIELFFDLRYHLEEFALAQYFCEMALRLTPEEYEPTEILRLVLNALYFLNKQSKPPLLIKSVTELKMISLAGFMPDLTVCAGCECEQGVFRFSYTEGCMFCSQCKGEAGESVWLTPTLLAAMRHIIYSPFEKIFGFEIPEQDLQRLTAITEKYVSVQSEHHFKTLDFYLSVKESVL